MTAPWIDLLVPIKANLATKSRLDGFAPGVRVSLMKAFARDALTAVSELREAPPSGLEGLRVWLVGNPTYLAGHGIDVISDSDTRGLNEALRHAAAEVEARHGAAAGRAVLLADLPCLRTEELAAALVAGATAMTRTFVPDAHGSGTTLLIAPGGQPLEPCFGSGSAAAHAASGAVPLQPALNGEWPTLRRDVDTAEDLAAAVQLGVGGQTAAVLARLAGYDADDRESSAEAPSDL